MKTWMKQLYCIGVDEERKIDHNNIYLQNHREPILIRKWKGHNRYCVPIQEFIDVEAIAGALNA